MSLTSAQLISEVRDCVLGASYTDATILRFLNRAVVRIAGMVVLPQLATSSTIQTVSSQAWADLPANYHRKLERVYSGNGSLVAKVYDSFLEFESHNPLLNINGDAVNFCAVRGLRLYYQPIPAIMDTLTLFYQRLPSPMVAPETPSGDEVIYPDGLPEHLADDLVIDYSAMELWKLIEQDDRNQVNVEKYERRFNRDIAELAQFIGPPDSDPILVRDVSRYC